MELEQKVARFRELYLKKRDLEEKYTSLYEKWREENKDLISELEKARASVVAAEEDLRQEAIEVYNATEQKEVYPGIKIAMYTRCSYDDKEAIRWAVNADLMDLLSVKKPAFEKVARTAELPFVEFKLEPVVRLSVDTLLGSKV